MGLGILADGKWISSRDQEDAKGRFVRPTTTFRNQITADGSSGYKAEAGRYHLYLEQQNAPTRTVLRLVVGWMRVRERFHPTAIRLFVSASSRVDERTNKFIGLLYFI
jgi:hypothetical protein